MSQVLCFHAGDVESMGCGSPVVEVDGVSVSNRQGPGWRRRVDGRCRPGVHVVSKLNPWSSE